MIVTINTDASYHPQFKVGAYAFWIVCNDGKILRSGVFKNEVKNSTEAEIKCIVNALHTLFESDLKGVTKVIINTDCKYFHDYQRKGKNRSVEARQYIKVCTEMVKKYGLRSGWIEVRHVKAHNGTDSARKWVNDWCDKAAKKMMREKVKQIK
jgi:ribonuclease HI